MFGKLLIALVLAVIALSVVARASHGAGPERVYTVRPYDTLWSIAASHYRGDPRETIWRLEQRNGLNGQLVRPGQKLVLP
ncbi:MAG: LysM peptidoglycan-binding domain-containing protein [Gaiellaceae bacterium]